MSGTVIVSENGQGRYQQEVITGQHRLIADEPYAMGGSDAGPAPFDFVMAGLGACTSMTLRMYAERREWPLTGIRVELSHDKVDIDGVSRDRISRDIELQGPLDDEQRRRLLEIAGKCPVHRALTAAFVVHDTLR